MGEDIMKLDLKGLHIVVAVNIDKDHIRMATFDINEADACCEALNDKHRTSDFHVLTLNEYGNECYKKGHNDCELEGEDI